jgi:hypothetical protein
MLEERHEIEMEKIRKDYENSKDLMKNIAILKSNI